MLTTYAHELSYAELVTFLERMFSKKFGKTVVKMEHITDRGASRVIDFKLITPNSIMLCRATFGNYECKVESEDATIGVISFKRDWAKYICEVLDNRNIIGNVTVTSYQYRADYNDFWTTIRDEKLKSIDKDYNETVLGLM